MSVWKKLVGGRGRSGSAVRPSARRSPLGFEALEDRRVLSAVVPTIAPVRGVVAVVAEPSRPSTDDGGIIVQSPSMTPIASRADAVVSSSRADGEATEGVITKFGTINQEIIAVLMGNPDDGADDRKPPVPPDKNPPPGPGPIGTPGASSSAADALDSFNAPKTVEDIADDFHKQIDATDVTDIIESQMPGYGAGVGMKEVLDELYFLIHTGPTDAVEKVNAHKSDSNDQSGGTGSGDDSDNNRDNTWYQDKGYPSPEDPYGLHTSRPQASTTLPH